MTVLIALAAVGLGAAGASAGLVGMVSVAIRREEKDLTLTSVATGKVVRLGRWLNGVYVRVPRHTAAADRQTTHVWRPGRPAESPAAAAAPLPTVAEADRF